MICDTSPALLDTTFDLSKNIKINSMKKIINRRNSLIAILLFTGSVTMAQKATDNLKISKTNEMKTYLIEREIPGAGKLTGGQLQGISEKSCGVLKELGPQIEWIHSYVTGNKIYCIYKAQNEELIRDHAKKGGFPANSIVEVSTMINPATAIK